MKFVSKLIVAAVVSSLSIGAVSAHDLSYIGSNPYAGVLRDMKSTYAESTAGPLAASGSEQVDFFNYLDSQKAEFAGTPHSCFMVYCITPDGWDWIWNV